MLIHYPNIDDHLDFLENQDGNLFFLPKEEIHRNNCDPFIEKVVEDIINGDDDHSVIIFERPAHRWEHTVEIAIKMIGAQVEKHDYHHQIHAFVVPTDLYQLLSLVDKGNLN